jgi:hypothetical protein
VPYSFVSASLLKAEASSVGQYYRYFLREGEGRLGYSFVRLFVQPSTYPTTPPHASHPRCSHCSITVISYLHTTHSFRLGIYSTYLLGLINRYLALHCVLCELCPAALGIIYRAGDLKLRPPGATRPTRDLSIVKYRLADGCAHLFPRSGDLP